MTWSVGKDRFKIGRCGECRFSICAGAPNGQLTLPVRCALLYYFNKRLRLDVASTVDDPKETPVVVVNKKEFDQAMKRLG